MKLKLGDRIIAKHKGESVIGAIGKLDCEDCWYDILLELSEYTSIGVMNNEVVEVINDDDINKVYSAYALYKIGHRTFSGSGISKDFVADDLDCAMQEVKEWLQENHTGADITWKDEPNYRFAENRAAGKCVLDASEKIDTGWPDSWISITLIPFTDSNRYPG